METNVIEADYIIWDGSEHNKSDSDELRNEDQLLLPNTIKYTDEQKIVSAVWMHERLYNDQTIEIIQNNFIARFNMPAPTADTLRIWEKRLFHSNIFERAERTVEVPNRKKFIDNVRKSLEKNPGITLSERCKQLGIAKATLQLILHEDLKMMCVRSSNGKVRWVSQDQEKKESS